MSDLRKAAEAALEALEWCEPHCEENPSGFEKWASVMPVLREALAQPEQCVMQKEALLLALEYLQLQKLYGPAIGFGNTTIDDAIAKCKHGIGGEHD